MRVKWLAAGRAAFLAGALAGAPYAAAAQEELSGAGVDPSCSASTRSSDRTLVLVCGETGFLLGNATTYSLVALPDGQATLLDSTYGDDRRLWLVVRGENGEYSLEEITGAVAQAVGRGTTLDVSGLSIDIRPAAAGSPITAERSRAGEVAVAASIDVSALAARARQGRLEPQRVEQQATGDAQ